MQRTDVIVLGAGMAGVSAALHLQQRGRSVVLVDRRGPGRAQQRHRYPRRAAVHQHRYPDRAHHRAQRVAGRILGMGDVVGLMQDFEGVVDQKKAEKDAERMLQGDFTLEDLVTRIRVTHHVTTRTLLRSMHEKLDLLVAECPADDLARVEEMGGLALVLVELRAEGGALLVFGAAYWLVATALLGTTIATLRHLIHRR